MKPWKRLKSKIILDHKFFRVRKDLVELPTGEIKEWVYWDSRDSAMVLGMTQEKKLVMTRQYRYLVGEEVIEFPAGGREEDEPIEDCARREFEEETGYRADKLIKLGAFYETYGQLNRKIHFYFAPHVRKTRQKLDHGSKGYEEIKVELVDFAQALQWAQTNKIVDMGSALAILLLKASTEKGEVSI